MYYIELYFLYLIDIYSIPHDVLLFFFTFFFVATVLSLSKKNIYICINIKHTQNVSGRFYRYILLQMRRRIKAVVLCLQGQDINLNGVFPISKTEVLHNSRYISYTADIACIFVCMRFSDYKPIDYYNMQDVIKLTLKFKIDAKHWIV